MLWFPTGTGNMDFALPMAFNSTEEGDDADSYSDIRLYTVQKCGGGSPHQCIPREPGPQLEFLNASFAGQRWKPASKRTVYGSAPWTAADYAGWESKIEQTTGGKGFSAACWFFGREIYKRRQYVVCVRARLLRFTNGGSTWCVCARAFLDLQTVAVRGVCARAPSSLPRPVSFLHWARFGCLL
jgi:hypothetical protein